MDTGQKTLIFGFAGLLMLILIIFFFVWRKKNKVATPAPTPDANATIQAQLQAQGALLQAQLAAQQAKSQEAQAKLEAKIRAQEAQALALLQAQQAQIPLTNEEFPLKVGSYGLRVKKLQTLLQKKYGWSGKIDGKLGTQTMQALKDKFKLTTDDFSQAKYELYNVAAIVVD